MMRRYARWIGTKLLLVLAALLLVASTASVWKWHLARQHNLAYADGSLAGQSLRPDDPEHAYAVAYLLSHQPLESKTIARMLRALALAEAAPDHALRARAKFAAGNLYFDLSAISGNIAAGGSHQQAVAQVELARESYKSALRLQPDMYAARFNLELLDRLSPEKRTQAWLAGTDGVTLQPFKRNGSAMMRDNTRRGLP
ncbi:MAG: hypothetical protein CVU26_00955 [Betaproteobacteria bacterium HGW-Betaproteobacteria-2]|nr:MAG: hypothetical protein CVU26_00955 [Betaproteobacteria bacterium HGW-Betaproteobacteria-2]